MDTAVVENKLSNLTDRVMEFDDRLTTVQKSVSSIETSLVLLVRLEERHSNSQAAIDRAFKAQAVTEAHVQTLRTEITSIQHELPGLKELRKWVIAGIAVGLTTLLGSLFNTMLSANKQQDFMYQLLQQRPTALYPSPTKP